VTARQQRAHRASKGVRLTAVGTVYHPVKDIEEYVSLKPATPGTGKASAIALPPLNQRNSVRTLPRACA
jgi:hypothetical protein